MISLKTLANVLVFLNASAILVFLISSGVFKSPEEAYLQESIESHKFHSKEVAFEVLNQLDAYVEVPEKHYSYPTAFGEMYLEIKQDPEYCEKVRKLVVEEPEIYFNQLNFFTDEPATTFMRSTLIPRVGKVLNPMTSQAKKTKGRPKGPFFMDPDVTITYMVREMHYQYRLGKEIGCLFQEYNIIPGIETLYRKDTIASAATNYTYKYADRPQCFDGNKFFPRTLALDNATECREWFNYINTKEYEEEKRQKTIVFIRKISVGSHQGKGVQPVDEDEEKNLTATYQNGKLCGSVKNPVIVQRYIHNPLLVVDHKFDFRIYMLIASVNPLIVYYHDGFLRVSLFEYDVTNKEKGMHLTNTAQSIRSKEKVLKEGLMNETELENLQMWNLTRFTNYLVEVGKVESIDWLETYLRPQFQHAMQHLIRMTQHMFFPSSALWQLLGIDFMLDDDLNLWFIEANAGPELKGTPKEKETLVTTMILDMFEIVHAQLKSRLKRTIKYINWLDQSGLLTRDDDGKVKISKLEQRKQEFADITKNYLDEEFEIRSDNGWVKIIDENKDGLDRYNYMFGIECFDI